MTEQFLSEACYQAKKWQEQGLEPFKMAVNISLFHFHEKDFPKFVRDCLEAVKLEPEFLDLEITEGVIMNQTEEQLRNLAAMQCDQAQGFFIKRPDPADEITNWIKKNDA